MEDEALLKANLEYWKNVAARYQKQRDDAWLEAQLVRQILLKQTGRAYDGNDWLRDIARTKTSNSFWRRIKTYF
jgi:hypothetical protein